jgi:hypothetical protein
LAAITLLLVVIPRQSNRVNTSPQRQSRSKFSALFSFHTPLFPPSAIISLTDDNSTFFLARPAAFGPLLPSNGLSGQLWIGSGFSDDNLGRGGLHTSAEGELGCSDVPGWDAGAGKVTTIASGGKAKHQKSVNHELPAEQETVNEKQQNVKRDESLDGGSTIALTSDDGTDDHLHAPSPGSDSSNGGKPGSKQQHADIESLQETAEIAGKVVLLSRGGCGFLEKVKWAQRRGGIALIVGDNVVGGPLVTMYAKGDTSNVTIPSLFTSHTTAHLLSSLIEPGGRLNSAPLPNTNEANAKDQQVGNGRDKSAKDEKIDFMLTSSSKSTSTNKGKEHSEGASPDEENKGWFRSFFSWFGGSDTSRVSRRPPSSGRLEWVRVNQFDDEPLKSDSQEKGDKETKGSKTTTIEKPKDDFVIGVQDWRDPDVLKTSKAHETSTLKSRSVAKSSKRPDTKKENELKGGSITPGSGEYEKPGSYHGQASRSKDSSNPDSKDKPHSKDSDSHSWFSYLFGSGNSSNKAKQSSKSSTSDQKQSSSNENHQEANPPNTNQNPKSNSPDQPPPPSSHHEGVWVTLTPTTMSTSPFFDTLLVLVVSPLITLTVVYALLLLRSRIRRRRWRAPKSVVERLPVRTYHTMPSEASSMILATSAAGAGASASTPLLQQRQQIVAGGEADIRSARWVLGKRTDGSRLGVRRQRSFTAGEVDESGASSVTPRGRGNGEDGSGEGNEDEKREAGLAEWRRRYGGRQKECVVCLEEYVDGVSRVMSLPCGHEFHVECM